ncbi:MAG: hypothetical protein KatS3mg068_1506 [Candidatus Sericytochromatia bacterium]|nr:MAG: hypothetical protein KatS3mg068_1506 [Candidatus Sericytochromatia bacterium]
MNNVEVYVEVYNTYFLIGVVRKFFYFDILNYLKENLSYYKQGYQYTPSFKNGSWDGKVYLFSTITTKDERYFNKSYFKIEIGFLDKILNFFNDRKILFKVIDKTKKHENIINKELKWVGKELRDYQKEAINNLLNNRIGIVSLPTGSGKMLLGAYLIYSLKYKVVLVVRNLESVIQTKNEIEESIENVKVGVWVTNYKDVENSDVIITTFNSLNQSIKSKNELYRIVSEFDCILVDEAHHISNNIFKKIIKYFNFYYIYGMTGTAYRNDKSDLELNGIFGDVVYKKNVKDLQIDNFLSDSEIFFVRVDKFELDKENFVKDFPGETYLTFSSVNKLDSNNLYKLGIVYNKCRNNIISNALSVYKGKKILILVKYIYHGNLLSRIFRVPFISGVSSKKKRTEILNKFRFENLNVLIASTIYDESVNIPELEVLINATGHSSIISQIQRHGRVIRKTKNKEKAIFIDFYDEFDRRVLKHTKKRISSMEKEGLEPIIINRLDKQTDEISVIF